MQLHDSRIELSPSDVTAFLACEHLTTLQLRRARGEIHLPVVENEQAELVFRKGLEHEAAFLAHLRAEGKSVAEISSLQPDLDWERGQRDTLEAMRTGIDVIYQAVFVHDGWRGVADFLLRTDGSSALGPWSYEVLDTKLARTAKPAYILQLCFYNEQLARLQERAPEQIHVLLGSGELASFRPDEFGAYYRRVRSRLVEFVGADARTTPYPNEHCGICEFKPVCDATWDEGDHLCRVAGIQRRQIDRLGDAGISTLAGLGRSPAEPSPAGIAAATFAKIRQQAELQLWAREHGRNRFVLLEPQPGAGFALLPDPAPGDLFFDFEGNPFWDKDGSLEYLWGILDTEQRFTPLWAHDHETERAAFETFVDLVHERLAQQPDLHVYHYAAYEITALKRLMGRYGTREHELDELLRREVFVDLYKVVRNGLRTSRPAYGLKEMEAFLDFDRDAVVKDGQTSIVMFEEWMQTNDQALLDEIAAYNEEDCVATLRLRDWLLERRTEALREFGSFPPLPPVEATPVREARVERAVLRDALLDAGEVLAAQLLDYHDRERKPVWWALFDRADMTSEELIEDADSVGGLVVASGPEPVKQSLAWTFTFPAQEYKLGAGQQPYDPETGRPAGTIREFDREERRLVLNRGPSLSEVPLPRALIPGRPYGTDSQEDALMRLGRSMLAGDRRYGALESVLRREPFARSIQTTNLEEMKALVRALDSRHLVIQGPPGSGKTWTAGRLIADLIQHGKRVGVASTSHKAIHNLLDTVEDAANESGIAFHGVKKASADNPESFYNASSTRIENVTSNGDCIDCDLAAGTAWLFSDADHDGTLDYLFIDEAGQVSFADALAMGTCARNLVLVGDPQQLDQVIQGTHPDGSDASVLKHLIGDEQTIASDRGLFLERTYRLHPDICTYISEEFYEGRLHPTDVAAARSTPFGTGLRFLPVEHDGRRQESPEEAACVLDQVEQLLASGMRAEQIIVVSPYNAQVNLLRETLTDRVRVGTVDKFQGQEADVVIYSMATSSGDDIPRGLEFLLSRNRLNVAISRARCLAYLVGSPRLLEVNARTIPQMRLANALCRYVELTRSAAEATSSPATR